MLSVPLTDAQETGWVEAEAGRAKDLDFVWREKSNLGMGWPPASRFRG